MPDACASGRLASRPISTVPMTADSAVAMYTASNETPSRFANIPGLTIRMYAIAAKVVSPAMISVRTVVPCFFSSNIACLPKKVVCAARHNANMIARRKKDVKMQMQNETLLQDIVGKRRQTRVSDIYRNPVITQGRRCDVPLCRGLRIGCRAKKSRKRLFFLCTQAQ